MIIRWQSDGTGCSSNPKEAATCEFVAPCERYTSRINGALSLGEQFRQGVRLLRLTCRAADGPAPPSLTLTGLGEARRALLLQEGRLRRRACICFSLP